MRNNFYQIACIVTTYRETSVLIIFSYCLYLRKPNGGNGKPQGKSCQYMSKFRTVSQQFRF